MDGGPTRAGAGETRRTFLVLGGRTHLGLRVRGSFLRGSGLRRGPRRGSALERSFTESRARAIPSWGFRPRHGRTRDTEVRDPGRGGASLAERRRAFTRSDRSGARRSFGGDREPARCSARLAARRSAREQRKKRRCVASSCASRGSTTRRSCPCVVRVANVGRPPSGPEKRATSHRTGRKLGR